MVSHSQVKDIGQKGFSWRVLTVLATSLLVVLSCSITSGSDPSLEQTVAALSVQQTVMAQQAGLNNQATTQAEQLTRVAQEVQATLLVQQATQLAAQANQQSQQPVSTEAPPPASTEQPVEVPAVNVEDQIKSAKILLFEDMAGTGELELIQEALDLGSFTYKDDGSAQGWLKDDLLSTTKWDLIIAASEYRAKIQGEFFVYLMEHINRGTAVIIEHWALDELSFGKVAPILAKCGVAFQRDWFFPLDTIPQLSVWPLVADHPVFQEPNSGISLRNFNNFWFEDEDKGDLLKLTGSGDATMLAGTIATSKSDHGTLVTCLKGRMIIQTFSTHEYNRSDITRLWQNYIHYTLNNHFLNAP